MQADAVALLFRASMIVVWGLLANPVIAGAPSDHRIPPQGEALQRGLSIYWGDLHGHTNVSDGTQNQEIPKRETPEDYFLYGRDVSDLDFLAITDHALNISEAEWLMTKQVAGQFDSPGSFVPFVGYEWSDEVKGHKVAIFPDLQSGPVYAAPSNLQYSSYPDVERPTEYFVDYEEFFGLAKASGAIIHAAHPSLGDSQTDWDYHDGTVQLNVEMAGTTGNPGGVAELWYEDPTTPVQHPNQSGVTGCWVQDALARRYRVGFLGVNDTHSCEPGLKAKTAVLAPDLTRQSLFDAIENRHVYAVSRDPVALSFDINDSIMGEELLTSDPLQITLSAQTDQQISRLEILKNNQVVWQQTVNDTSGTLSVSDLPSHQTGWYYGRAILANGHRAWSSPIWVQDPTPVDESIIFSDDFEGHTDVATTWVDSADRDPGTPPIGFWNIRENEGTRVQATRSPVSSSYHAFDTPYGDQFLHLWRDTSGVSEAWAGISAEDQALLETNGSMRVEVDLHSVDGLDGWGGNLGIAAFDSAPGDYSRRAFDVAFRAVNGGLVVTYDGQSVVQSTLSDVFDGNTWEHVTIDVDFTTDRWSVMIDDVTVADLAFAGGDLDKIQYVMLAAWDYNGTAGRGGFDNLIVRTPIPDETAIPGDFNLDGSVDVSDLGILATNYGTSSGMTLAEGDADGDGDVDVSDLGILATNYGTAASAARNVPEPTAISLLFMLLFLLAVQQSLRMSHRRN